MPSIKTREYMIVSEIISKVLNAYNDNGTLTDEYYNNIILRDLSEYEIKILRDF